MNLNDYKYELIYEEQLILEELIRKMDKVIDKFDIDIQKYIKEAKRAIGSMNPDEYKNIVDSNKSIKERNKQKSFIDLNKKDLYSSRLILETTLDGKKIIKELKVGLHTCRGNNETFIYSWQMKVFRHYLFEMNPSREYHGKSEDEKNNDEVDYLLLFKDDLKVKTGIVTSVVNKYPRTINLDLINELKKYRVFSDVFFNKLMSEYKKGKIDEKEVEKIIADEFLQELLERRSTPEFKNIVFSIQKKQGEIIQLPYNKNIIVQGCAGSGKSMIMMHRIPIILFDNPRDIPRNSIYVISPSSMYIQMAKSMRDELEISDIEMGTVEQYYDDCIERYVGHSKSEYGKLSFHEKTSHEIEVYIYSERCIKDIKNCYEDICNDDITELKKIFEVLGEKFRQNNTDETYSQKINNRIIELERLLLKNKKILEEYYKHYREIMRSFNALLFYLKHRREKIERYYLQEINELEEEIKGELEVIDSMNYEEDNLEISNREKNVELKQKLIEEIKEKIQNFDNEEYFIEIKSIIDKLSFELKKYKNYQNEFAKIDIKEIYNIVLGLGDIIGLYYSVHWNLSRVDDIYSDIDGSIEKRLDVILKELNKLNVYNKKYIDYKYYDNLMNIKSRLTNIDKIAVKQTYEFILKKIGLLDNESEIKAYKFSAYLYLQIMYLYYGKPTMNGNLLITVDEAQSLSKEEYRLILKVNNQEVFLNLFGDCKQHIEGSKGIDSWDELSEIFDYEKYDIKQNYRNATQITEYCNRKFNMKMQAINTIGEDVVEIDSKNKLYEMIPKYLNDYNIMGLKAIVVKTMEEAKYIVDTYYKYSEVFNDMTGGKKSIKNDKWNIILIEDAKGLEFEVVIALSGRMSENEKYIAYTRALDELIVYEEVIEEHPPIVEKFDRDVYIAWAKYLGLLDEKYEIVRKKDRHIVYDHMYGNVTT